MEAKRPKPPKDKPSASRKRGLHLVEQLGTCTPGEIYGHTSVSYKNKIYVFGGNDKAGYMNDFVHEFSFDTHSWNVIKATDGPKGRHFHTANVHNGGMFIFGGKNNSYMNDLWRFDLETHVWSPVVAVSGRPPSKRYGHSVVFWGNSLWVFGGFDDFGYKSDELFQFNLDSKMWHKIETFRMQTDDNPLLLEKYQHTAVVVNNSMFVWGGRGDKKQDFNNELLQYTFGTRTWARVFVKGKAPSPRWGHKTVMWNGKMYICGGCDYVLNFNDIHRFNFDTETWTKIDTGGVDFDPRFYHAASVLGNSMIIFAGRNMHNYLFNELYRYNFCQFEEAAPDTFYQDTRKIITNSKFNDITFTFPDENNKCLYAHKGVLAGRSETFRRMFRSKMREGKSETKDIVIMDSFLIFEALLMYLYTSTLVCDSFNVDQLVELLLLADRYLLLHLKSLCEKKLKGFVTTKTVMHLYDIAERSKADQLKRACVKFTAKYLDVFDPKDLSDTLTRDVRLLLEIEKPKGIYS